MYLQPAESMALITACADAVPGRPDDVRPAAVLVRLVARRGCGRRDATGYRRCRSHCRRRRDRRPRQRGARRPCGARPAERPARGRVLNALMWTFQRIPLLDSLRRPTTLLEFGCQPNAASTYLQRFDPCRRRAPSRPPHRCWRRSPSRRRPGRSARRKCRTVPGFRGLPADSNSRYARATVFTAMLISPASSRTVGRRVPGGSRPSRIPPMIWILS